MKNKMDNQEFSEDQLKELDKFLNICQLCTLKKINPSFLLYAISKNKKQNRYTKSNFVLLRDTLPKRKRLQLEFLLRKK